MLHTWVKCNSGLLKLRRIRTNGSILGLQGHLTQTKISAKFD